MTGGHAEFDPSVPSPARMYDFFLGGKDNYAADREAAEAVLATAPQAIPAARANRRFLVEVVRRLAGEGIDQFLDLGTGIPTSPNVHEVARESHPGARVVYVDNDPVVTAHNRALRATHDGVIGVEADIRDPAAVIDHPDIGRVIDWGRPVAVLMIAVAHFLTDADRPAALTAALRDRCAPGSHLALTHGTADPANLARAQEAAAAGYGATFTVRTPEQITGLFAGWDLLPPGLAPVDSWPDPAPVTGITIAGGLARRGA